MKKICKFIFVAFLSLGLSLLSAWPAAAQCAMCRATIENNVSSGVTSIGSGLNTGILYLLVMPYLAFVVIAYFWYRNSKQEHEKTLKITSYLRRKMPPLSSR